MNLERDHHGLVSEVYPSRGPGRVGAGLLIGGMLSLPTVSAGYFLAQAGHPFMGALGLAYGLVTGVLGVWLVADLIRLTLQRVTLRLTTDALTVEVKRPLRPRCIDQVPLQTIEHVEIVRTRYDPFDRLVRLSMRDGGTIVIPSVSFASAQQLVQILEAAVRDAPEHEPAEPVPPPELERLRRALQPERP